MRPWRVKQWIIPKAGSDFVCSMEAVLAVYEREYNVQNPVVCLDESPHQLISEVRSRQQDEKGVVYEDYEYKREGVADIYMITEPKGGRRDVLVQDSHNSQLFGKSLIHIARQMYPAADKITLICDNLSSHKISSLYELLPPEQARAIITRLEIVNTPKHGSWLNIAECELSVLKKQGLTHRIATQEELARQCQLWAAKRNQEQKGVDWQFKTKDARIKLKKLYPNIIT